MKVDIIGTYPPPIGGTSIHLQRLYDRCVKEGLETRILDTHGKECAEDGNRRIVHIGNYKKFLLKYLTDASADIIHSHTHSWVERMFLTVKAKMCSQRIVFTFHSFRDNCSDLTLFQKVSAFIVKRYADYFIATSPQVKDKLISWGIKERKVSIIKPFILPDDSSKGELDEDIEKAVVPFSMILCANASNNDHYNGEDLYGLDMCINLQAEMRKKYNCCFIYVLTKITDKIYLEEIRKRISEQHLRDCFFLITHPINFITLVSRAAVCIRPTNTDSWALSISEALYLKCPVIASDVCVRENGCILFKTRCQQELNKKADMVLSDLAVYKEKLEDVNISDESDKIFEIYRKICDNPKKET